MPWRIKLPDDERLCVHVDRFSMLLYWAQLYSTVLYCLQDLKFASWWHGGPEDVRKIPREWTIRCSTMVALEFLPNLASGSYHSSRPLQQPATSVWDMSINSIPKPSNSWLEYSPLPPQGCANDAARLEYLSFFMEACLPSLCHLFFQLQGWLREYPYSIQRVFRKNRSAPSASVVDAF